MVTDDSIGISSSGRSHLSRYLFRSQGLDVADQLQITAQEC